MHLHHPLLLEFASHRDVIQKLKDEQAAFRQMADEYHAIDRKVCRIERAYEFATDAETEDLKKRRLWLKDQIFHAICKATAATVH